MKRYLFFFLLLLLLCSLAGCKANHNSLDVAWSDTTIDVDDTAQLQMSDAVFWESSDESVATVDQSGVVTGIAAGEVTITAEAADGVRTNFTITVQ